MPEYRTTVSHAISEGEKYCNGCKSHKPLSDFSESAESKSGYAYTCKRCFSAHQMFQNAKKRCEKEGNTVDFTLEDIKGMVVATCPVFGIPLQYGGRAFNAASATIDAVDHAIGHIKSNMRIISAKANTIKNNATPDEMKVLIESLQKWNPPCVPVKEKVPRTRHTVKDGVKSCSSCQKEFPIDMYPKDASSRTGHSTRCIRCTAIKTMVQNAKSRAAKKELSFDIDFDYLVSISPISCPVFGIELQYANGKLCDSSASLDRFDPRQGYVKGNVWVICDKANRMKSDGTIEDMIAVYNYAVSSY